VQTRSKCTDVSKEHVTSFFMAEYDASSKQNCFMLQEGTCTCISVWELETIFFEDLRFSRR
jgi:hypothetical protein